MIEIEVTTRIKASAQRCFDLSRSQAAHIESAKDSGERIVKGPSYDLLELGDEVTFEGRHFGVRFHLCSKITEMQAPGRFVDEMQSGPFRALRHEHLFEEANGETQMIDRVQMTLPMGALGQLVAGAAVKAHMTRFLRDRGEALKRMAE